MSIIGDDLEQLCDPAYLEGLDAAPVTELRQRRDACQRAEVLLSYLRRVIQGEMDLVTAELELRSSGETSDVGRLVEELPTILARERGTSDASHEAVPSIPGADEALVNDVSLDELLAQLSGGSTPPESMTSGLLAGANLCAFSQDELLSTLERLRIEETRISSRRRVLHEHLDAIQGAIVDRYKSGTADADSLLA